MDYETKADNLDAVFDGAVPAMAVTRPVLSGGKVADPARSAFVDGYLRRGSEVELKSFTGVTPADGGFAVPREIDEVIDSVLKSISPIRAISSVVRVGSAGYRKLVTQNGVTSGWAAETATRPETGTPTFNEIVPSFGDLYANPAATQAMLDDAAVDVEAWLADEIASEFAKLLRDRGFDVGNVAISPVNNRSRRDSILWMLRNGTPWFAKRSIDLFPGLIWLSLAEIIYLIRSRFSQKTIPVLGSKGLIQLKS
jgi:hypothetical protein